jgi:hypothetical protein
VTQKDAFQQAAPAHSPAPQKTPHAPKAGFQSSTHRNKPTDQFLQNKPFARKG